MGHTERSVQLHLRGGSSLTPEVLMSAIVHDPLPNMFVSWHWVPGVKRTQVSRGSWNDEGAQRVLYMADGKQMLETAVRVRPGFGFTYRLTNFTNGLRLFLTSVDDVWQFDVDEHGGTQVQWRWVLHSRPGRHLLTRLFAALWRRYMTVILTESLQRLTEAQQMARVMEPTAI